MAETNAGMVHPEECIVIDPYDDGMYATLREKSMLLIFIACRALGFQSMFGEFGYGISNRPQYMEEVRRVRAKFRMKRSQWS